MARLIDRDLAQALQDRILADQTVEKTADMPGDRPGDPRRVEALEAQIAAMEKAVADAEALGERRRQEAESAARRVEALEAQIATLEEASPRPRVRPSSGAGNPGWPTSGPTVSLRSSSS